MNNISNTRQEVSFTEEILKKEKSDSEYVMNIQNEYLRVI